MPIIIIHVWYIHPTFPNKDGHFEFNGKISKSHGWYIFGDWAEMMSKFIRRFPKRNQTKNNTINTCFLFWKQNWRILSPWVQYLKKTLVMGWPPGPRTQCHPDRQDDDLHFLYLLFIPGQIWGFQALPRLTTFKAKLLGLSFHLGRFCYHLGKCLTLHFRDLKRNIEFLTVVINAFNFANIHDSLIPRIDMSSQKIWWLWWFDAWLGISKMFSSVCFNWSHVKCWLCTSGMLKSAGHIWGSMNIYSAHLDMTGRAHEEDAYAIDSSVTVAEAFRAQFRGCLR